MNITSKENRIINIVRDLNVGECGEQPEVENMHHRFQEIFYSCAVDINMASCEGIIGSLVKKNIPVKESAEKMRKILFDEGFTTVKFEHKQPLQIGDGLSLKLKKPWEMHVRLFLIQKIVFQFKGKWRYQEIIYNICSVNVPQ